jgi:hypothetical protein
MDGRRLLGIYLNDHLAGANAGRELAKRSLGRNRGTPYGDELAVFLVEVEQDVEALREVMRRVNASPDPLKAVAAIVTERLGRLKLNGRILSYSPLSRLVELEGLVLGVRGKLAMWEVLDGLELPELSDMPFGRLIERAASQIERLDSHRLPAAADAFLD